jgi:hypothetical protein
MIRSFGSFDEMMDAMQKDHEQASANIQGWQRNLIPGDCFVRRAYGIDIWGKVIAQDDADLDADYRFCFCFSVACQSGEFGDVHISTVVERKTEQEFFTEYALHNNGQLPPLQP